MRFRAGAIVVLAVALVACGVSPEVRPDVSLSNVRHADSPPAYWLGERFEGLPLAANAGTGERPTFVYGTCMIRPGSDGGCAPPLQLQHWPLAERFPNKFEIAPGRRTSCRLLDVAQITAAVFETTGGVEVYLRERVVVLFGEPVLIRKAMSTLRPVRPQSPGLPSPPAWVREQLRRCAPPSPETKLRELRTTGGPPVYWLGPSFEGHPLALAEGDAEEARIVYGECARDELAFDAACWPPLEVRVLPLQSPGACAASIECRVLEATGVPAALLPGAHTLDVFAGERTIRLIGPDLELLSRAADALRRLDESERSTKLPGPPPMVTKSLRDRCN